jgi:hypothetical protein
MHCQTVRIGKDCTFWKQSGCTFNGGSCKPVVEQCQGCARIVEYPTGKYCAVAPDPVQKWKLGHCNMATHMKLVAETKAQRLNPIKASKRSKK